LTRWIWYTALFSGFVVQQHLIQQIDNTSKRVEIGHKGPVSPTQYLSVFHLLSVWYGELKVLWSLKQQHDRWAEVEFAERLSSLEVHRLPMARNPVNPIRMRLIRAGCIRMQFLETQKPPFSITYSYHSRLLSPLCAICHYTNNISLSIIATILQLQVQMLTYPFFCLLISLYNNVIINIQLNNHQNHQNNNYYTSNIFTGSLH